MYRERGASDVDTVEFDALTEIVARVQRLSRRVIVGSLLLGVAAGVVACLLTLDDYQGPGGRALGARLGYTFALAAGAVVFAGVPIRRRLIRWRLRVWIHEMAALGVNTDGLRGALAAFIE